MLADDELAEIRATHRWYSLAADEDGFAIWDLAGASADPVSEFARADDGSEEAWAEFRRLTQRRHRLLRLPELGADRGHGGVPRGARVAHRPGGQVHGREPWSVLDVARFDEVDRLSGGADTVRVKERRG